MNHLKLTILTICLLFVTQLLTSQISVKLGASLGANYPSLDLGRRLEARQKTIRELYFGISSELRWNWEWLALQPELNYIRKGGKLIHESVDRLYIKRIEERLQINYLEIPVLIKFQLGFGSDRFKLFVAVGPTVGMALNGKFSIKEEERYNGTLIYEDFYEEEIKRNAKGLLTIKRFELGAVAGAGFSYRIRAITLFSYASYRRGFSNLVYNSVWNEKITNRNLGISIGGLIHIETIKRKISQMIF